MRRDIRRKNQDEELSIKIVKYSSIGLGILAIIVFALLIYCKSLNSDIKEGTLTGEQISNILNNTKITNDIESASSEIGKSINEVQNDVTSNIINSNNTIVEKNGTESNVLKTENIVPTTSSVDKTKTEKKEEVVELKFEKPVEGDIIRDFALETLIYSETLQEWTTHTGIDIKADKTTVVKSAEEGTIKSIKNDPRYGLTITIEHQNGFKTVYSNLLSSEFVVEGEKVEKGQAIGTVGNTASFEIADEPHLHFEIIKDNIQLDPNIYLK